MKSLYFISILVLVLGCSQKKEVVLSECQKNNTGDLLVKSVKDYDRNLSVNNNFKGIIKAKSDFLLKNISAGKVKLTFIEILDSVSYIPEFQEIEISLSQCEYKEYYY